MDKKVKLLDKISQAGYTLSMRTYGQYCSIAKALDVVGDRWTLLIVREVLIRGAEPATPTSARDCPGSPPTCWPTACATSSARGC